MFGNNKEKEKEKERQLNSTKEQAKNKIIAKGQHNTAMAT